MRQSSLNMFGFVDDVFTSAKITIKRDSGGSYVNGIWQSGAIVESVHNATVQPLSIKEVNQLDIGADRIKDYFKIYINDESIGQIDPRDKILIDDLGGEYQAYQVDNRISFGRGYCKIIAAKVDV